MRYKLKMVEGLGLNKKLTQRLWLIGVEQVQM